MAPIYTHERIRDRRDPALGGKPGFARVSLPKRQIASSSIVDSSTGNVVYLDILVKIRLLGSIAILRQQPPIDERDRANAERIAREALKLATNGNNATLQARCCYYIAYSLIPLERSATHRRILLNYFNRALDAEEGGLPEAQWAQMWLEEFAKLYPSSSKNSRSNVSSSFLGRILGSFGIARLVDGPEGNASLPGPSASLDEPDGQRLPSFKSWTSTESSAASISSSPLSPSEPTENTSLSSNEDARSSSSIRSKFSSNGTPSPTSEAAPPRHVRSKSTNDIHSPTAHSCTTHDEDDKTNLPALSPRRFSRSFTTIPPRLTLRRRSVMAQMEEGNSPVTSIFNRDEL